MTAIDRRETGVVAAGIVAIVFAKLYFISRIGFDNPLMLVIEVLGLSLFLTAAPLAIARFIGRGEATPWWRSQSFAMLAAIVSAVLAGVAADRSGYSVLPALAAIGFVCFVWTLARWLMRDRIRWSLAFVIGASIFALWCAGVMWGSRYKMPLFWEQLAYNANIHHDTFYYGSIANVMHTYGVPSTGLDGVPTIRYHFGSMYMLGRLADLSGTDVLTFYSLGYPIVILPALFAALLVFSTEVSVAFGIGEGTPLRRDWRAWLVLVAATIGFIPASALDAFAIWNSNALISESYLTGFPIFFLLMSMGLLFWRDRRGELWSSPGSIAFLMVILPVVVAALGFLKLSLMSLAFLLVLYLVARLRLVSRPMVLASVAVTVVAVLLTFRRVALSAQNQGVVPLDFMRFNSAEGWQQFFPLMHLLWTWVYVALRLWEDGVRNTADLARAVRARRLIDVEILLVIAIGGFIPGEIFSIHGGSAVYFSDVQRWVAIGMLMARMPLWAARWREGRPARQTRGSGWKSARLSTVLAVFVGVPFIITMVLNTFQWPLRDLRANLGLRRELTAQGGGAPGGIRSLANAGVLRRGIERSEYYPVIRALREISRLPLSERRQSLLFIPQSSTQYWSMFTSDGRCTFTPLIAPAISTVAMVDGMPAYNCEVTPQYNMDAYRPRVAAQTPADTAIDALCRKVRLKGLRKLIVLDAPAGSAPRWRRADCYLP